jgi:hypothetical protein
VFPVAGDVTVENELKPDPVRVTGVAAAPTTSGVVAFDELITGATRLAVPIPKAPVSW